MSKPFHLSLPVHSLDACVDFYVSVLNGKVAHRDASGYVNIDVPGCRLTLHAVNDMPTPGDTLHFGINLDLAAFAALAERMLDELPSVIVEMPHVVDAGTPVERRKMYLRCPAGYLIEIKGHRNSDQSSFDKRGSE